MRRALCLVGAFLFLAAGLLALLGERYWPRPFVCGLPSKWTAQAKCKEYHDAAAAWARFRGAPPARLAEMEAPLRPGEPDFIDVVDDTWGNPYMLERDGTDVRIRCVGPDGQARTEDDIVYPEEAK